MAKMQTLTINGQKFVVDDSDAVQKDSSAVSGAVPTADGNGGVSWQENTSDVVYVAVTETDGTYTADKTSEELLEAYNAGKTLVCKYPWVSGNKLIAPLWMANTYTSSFVFRVLYKESDQSRLINIVINGKGVSVSVFTVFPEEGTEGQILTKTATGVAWGDAPSGTFIVAGTLGEDGTVTLDKTYAEMKEAYAAGKELLVRLTNTDYTAELPLYGYWLGGFVFHKITGTGPLTAELLTVSSEDVVYLNQTLELDELPEDGTPGQYLSLDAGGIPVWADFPEQETELPSGGTAGQVLTIGSDGSPVWADPTTLTSVYEGVF